MSSRTALCCWPTKPNIFSAMKWCAQLTWACSCECFSVCMAIRGNASFRIGLSRCGKDTLVCACILNDLPPHRQECLCHIIQDNVQTHPETIKVSRNIILAMTTAAKDRTKDRDRDRTKDQ